MKTKTTISIYQRLSLKKTLLMLTLLLGTAFVWQAEAQGETCDGPITISSLPFTDSGNTSTYGDNYSGSDMPPLAPNAVTNGSSSNYLGGDDVVYSYTAAADGLINVNATGVGTWVGMYVFTGCSPFEWTVGSHTSNTAGNRSIPSLPVIQGETYFIIISTWPTPQSTDYTLSIEEDFFDCPNLEANIGDPCDDGDPNTINDVVTQDCECEGVIPPDGMICEAPIEIGSLPYTTTDNTENYGDDYGSADRPALAPDAVGNPSANYLNGDDVVYSYTPTANGLVDISVTDHGTYAGVFVFTGCSPFESTVGGHTLSSGTDDLEVIGLPVNAGITYYIVISTWASPQSTPYTLTVTAAEFDCPALEANIGDPCDDGDPNTVNDTVNADCECEGIVPGPGASCESAISVDCNVDPVTYSSVGSTATNTTSCTMGSSGLWFSFVGTGGDITVNSTADFDHEMSINTGGCGDLTNLGCDDQSTGAETYTITASVSGQMYYVYIAHYSGSSTVTGNITIDIDCAAPITCPAPTDLAVDNITSNSADLSWTTDASQSDIYLVAAGDPAPDENSTPTNMGVTSPITLDNLTANTSYDVYVRADCGAANGVSSWVGPENFSTLATPLDNDNCIDAIALACGDSIFGTTIGATQSGMPTPTCATGTPADVFYTLEVTAGTEYTVTVQGADYDAVLAIYSGDCGNLVEIDCADNGFSAGVEETITYTPGTDGTIVIRTYDWSTSQGSFTISVSCEGGSVCEAPLGITVTDVTEDGANIAWSPANAGDDQWEISLTVGGQSADDGMIAMVSGTPEYTAAGLDPDTTYGVYLRTICSNEISSDWAYNGDFTTLEEGPTPCEAPYNDNAANSDVYISNIEIAGIGIDIGNPDYDFTYTSSAMSPNGYQVITNPTATVYPGLEGEYTVSSGPSGNSNEYYYSVWVDLNQDGCFDTNEQIIWSDGGIPNGQTGVTNVPMTWGDFAPGTYQARIRNSMIAHPLAEGNGDGEALDFTLEVITEEDAQRLLGIGDQVFTNFSFYPNPVEDQLSLKANTPIEQVVVYNLVGQKVIQSQPNALEANVATGQLQSGVYLMDVTIDGSQKTFRVVKK